MMSIAYENGLIIEIIFLFLYSTYSNPNENRVFQYSRIYKTACEDASTKTWLYMAEGTMESHH